MNKSATLSNFHIILQLILELVQYEKLGKTIVNLENVKKTLFYKALNEEIIICQAESAIVVFIQLINHSSIFQYKLYIREKYRANIYSNVLIYYIYQSLAEINCYIFQLLYLSWNKSLIDFYLKLVREDISILMAYRFYPQK